MYQIFGTIDLYCHLPRFNDFVGGQYLNYSLRSFNRLDFLSNNLFIFFTIIHIITLLFISRMHRRSLSRPDNEAINEEVSLHIIGVLFGVEHPHPSSVELMVQIPIQSGKTYRVLSDDLIGQEGVMIVKLHIKLKCFKLIFVHINVFECQRLVPSRRVDLVLLFRLLNLPCALYFDEGIRLAGRVFTQDITTFYNSDTHEILFLLKKLICFIFRHIGKYYNK